MLIYVDIDDTICERSGDELEYGQATPLLENIAKVNRMYEAGHTVVYWTARGTLTGVDWYGVTLEQLVRWGAKHHRLEMGKPCFDLFIDDKALNSLHHWTDENVGMVILK